MAVGILLVEKAITAGQKYLKALIKFENTKKNLFLKVNNFFPFSKQANIFQTILVFDTTANLIF